MDLLTLGLVEEGQPPILAQLCPTAQCAERSVRACSVCGEEEETTLNHLLQCDGCRGFVHMACYGVPSPPEGRLWLCDLCTLGAAHPQSMPVL